MRGVRRRHVLGSLIAKLGQIDSEKQMLTSSQKNRRNRDVHLIDKSSLQILPDRADTTTEVEKIYSLSRPESSL